MKFQERFLLHLCNDENLSIVKKILESPLGLAKDLIKCLFENDFDSIKNRLDTIKKFTAGITRAENLGRGYKLAEFYPYLFSFHQYFHSSYRARQGKALEECLKEVIRNCDKNINVPDKQAEKIKIMASIFTGYTSRLDMDVIAQESNDVLIIQLRSRDDTGGSTAKSSLVEVLRDALALKPVEGISLIYLIGIWDAIDSAQKAITIKKIYSSLKTNLPGSINEESFTKEIVTGIELYPGIVLKLAYGTTEISQGISDWAGIKHKFDSSVLETLITRLIHWDDLWLAYTVTSIELENMKVFGNNNIIYLGKLLKDVDPKFKKVDMSSQEKILEQANTLTMEIIPLWTENSICLSSVSEKAHYIRDLLLLRLIYKILIST